MPPISRTPVRLLWLAAAAAKEEDPNNASGGLTLMLEDVVHVVLLVVVLALPLLTLMSMVVDLIHHFHCFAARVSLNAKACY